MKDPKEIFDSASFECSKIITHRYSTSFTIGIRTMDKKYHLPIYAIYGFVRFADEIVDTFHDMDKQVLLENFSHNTFKAIEDRISLNPVLHAFQIIVHDYEIEPDLIKAFFKSMAMDLNFKNYNDSNYQEYIYGSAEVVGLMCLKIFCKGNKDLYEKLKYPACKLGAAFQKVNFLRDLKSDYEERGRIYFPGVDYNKFDSTVKKSIEEDIQVDFNEALKGIKKLPVGVRLGVKIAYFYYLKLFLKIKGLSPEVITRKRIRIPNANKISLLITTYCGNKLGLS